MIYLDNAATTRPFLEVKEAMIPYLDACYGNPSAAYQLGEDSKKAVEQARTTVASTLEAGPDQIFFTSGGTESDNWALRLALDRVPSGSQPHIITSVIEHHAILHTCERLQKEGVRITYIPVGPDGRIRLSELEKAICPQTVLISVMYANNEIGTIQPVDQIAQIARRYHILFHTDAVQAYGQIPVFPERTGIDLLSASGHKFNGPKGTGFLYAAKRLKLTPWMLGGVQEKGMRAGTENVPGIVGMGKAAGISHRILYTKMRQEIRQRNVFLRRVFSEIKGVKLNGSPDMRLPNNINLCIDGVNAQALVALMDMEGICISAASACSAGSDAPSHVQLAIGNTREQAFSSIRITLGRETTGEELDRTFETMKRLIRQLR